MQGNLMGADWKPPSPMGGTLQDLVARLRGGGMQMSPYAGGDVPVGMSLQPYGGAYTNYVGGQGELGAGSGQLALGAGSNPASATMGPSLAAEELSALRNQAMSGAGDAAGAFEAGGGVTGLGELGAGATEAGGATGLLSRLAGITGTSGMGPMGALKTFGARAPMAIGAAAVGQGLAKLNDTFGGGYNLHTPIGVVNQGDVSAELRGAGTGAGIGTMILPGWGTAFGALGGAAVGGATNVLNDYAAVNKYGDLVDKFINVNKHMPKAMRADAKAAALQVHNSDGTIAQKATEMSKLIGQMQKVHAQYAAQKGQPAIPVEDARQLAIRAEMASQMNKISQSAVDQGDALAASERASIPNLDPRLAPLVENDAANRAAYGRQMQESLVGSTYMQPQIDAMNAQLAQLAQLQQSLQAQGGGQSIAQLLAQQAQGKK